MLINKIQKGVYAPGYYADFQCLAGRCRHSCCVDWEICIDEMTYAKYEKTQDILETVRFCEDGPCFSLREDGRCPHLNDAGLCNIILTYGEGYLSEICQNHPRFYNYINNSRVEVGLGIVCEEACRLLLAYEGPFSLSKTEDIAADEQDDDTAAFDPIPQRDQMISMIEMPGSDYEETVFTLKRTFGIPALYTPEEWLCRFLSLEILDTDWKDTLQRAKENFLQNSNKYKGRCDKHYRRLLTYFIYRHVSVAESEINLRARLAFSILSVQVIRSLFEQDPVTDLSGVPETLIDYARRYSAEIEYSEDNTDELIFACECKLNFE